MYRSEQRRPMVFRRLAPMCSVLFLCSSGEAVWLITQRKPACWIINFASPLPYFFFPLHIFLMRFLLPFFCLLFAKPLLPSFSLLWPIFLPMELTTSISHWRLVTLPSSQLASHLGWVYLFPLGLLCLRAGKRGRERERERERSEPREFELCCISSISLASH